MIGLVVNRLCRRRGSWPTSLQIPTTGPGALEFQRVGCLRWSRRTCTSGSERRLLRAVNLKGRGGELGPDAPLLLCYDAFVVSTVVNSETADAARGGNKERRFAN
jgi:hypothetical protein